MAYTLEIGIHNSILEWIHNKEVYLNDVRIDDPESYSFGTKVEINHNDKLKIVLSAENKRICYSKDGKYVSAIPEGTFSKSLPLGNYRFYTEDCYDDDFIEGHYQATILVTFKHPLEGTKPVYKRVNGGWRKQTAYERAEGWWVKLSTTDTISFTIDGETWYARSGMTWSEWCNANDYSLNSWHIFGTNVAPLDNSKYIVGVTGDTTIVASASYTTLDFDDSNVGSEEITITIEKYSANGSVYEGMVLFTALEGMTWLEFCNSEYNKNGWQVNTSNQVQAIASRKLYYDLGKIATVSGNDAIITDKTYYLISHEK